MNRERLFKHLEEHYIPKREMISRIPLGVQPDEFWQDVLNRRRSRSISLQIYFFVTQDEFRQSVSSERTTVSEAERCEFAV